jgi:cobalt-zinc-cadmium efflux system protein
VRASAAQQSWSVGTSHTSHGPPSSATVPHHDHEHQHGGHAHGGHAHAHGTSSRLFAITVTLTLSYCAVEAGMGLWTGSLALLADAGHMLTDSGSLLLSMFVARIAQRPRSANMTYGYRRAEIIGAVINAATMLAISLFILVEAIKRLGAPTAIHGSGLLYTALGGLLLNLVAAGLLMRGAKDDMNVRSALLHVMGDALGSLAAIIAGLCVTLFGFTLADPLASLAIAGVIGFGSLRLLREAAEILMEATPPDVDIRALERTIVETPGVSAVHDLHVWCLTPSRPMLTAHVVLTPAAHGTDVSKRVGERLHALHGLDHVTIQPEPPVPELIPLRLRGERKKG